MPSFCRTVAWMVPCNTSKSGPCAAEQAGRCQGDLGQVGAPAVAGQRARAGAPVLSLRCAAVQTHYHSAEWYTKQGLPLPAGMAKVRLHGA